MQLVRPLFEELGVPYEPLTEFDSGNGYAIIFRVDQPADDDTDKFFERILKGIKAKLDGDAAEIDVSVASRNRLIKIPGTLAAKGDPIPGREHRLGRLLKANPDATILTREQLDKIAALCPEEKKQKGKQSSQSRNGTRPAFDLEAWLQKHNVPVRNKHAWDGGPLMWETNCIRDDAHNGGEAWVGQRHDGALTAGCQHQSCTWTGATSTSIMTPIAVRQTNSLSTATSPSRRSLLS